MSSGEASQVPPRLAVLQETNDGLDPFLVTALSNPRDRLTILKLDLELERFMKDARLSRLEFPPLASYQRLIVHRVAEYFRLEHTVTESEALKRPIVLEKTAQSKIPALRFSDLVEPEEEAPSPKMTIMRRRNGPSPLHSAPASKPAPKLLNTAQKAASTVSASEANVSTGEKSAEEKEPVELTPEERELRELEEREAAYARARARIFSESESSASSTPPPVFTSTSTDAIPVEPLVSLRLSDNSEFATVSANTVPPFHEYAVPDYEYSYESEYAGEEEGPHTWGNSFFFSEYAMPYANPFAPLPRNLSAPDLRLPPHPLPTHPAFVHSPLPNHPTDTSAWGYALPPEAFLYHNGDPYYPASSLTPPPQYPLPEHYFPAPPPMAYAGPPLMAPPLVHPSEYGRPPPKSTELFDPKAPTVRREPPLQSPSTHPSTHPSRGTPPPRLRNTRPTTSGPTYDYTCATPSTPITTTDASPQHPSHILEVSYFLHPSSHTEDIESAHSEIRQAGASVKCLEDGRTLAIFKSSAAAKTALSSLKSAHFELRPWILQSATREVNGRPKSPTPRAS